MNIAIIKLVENTILKIRYCACCDLNYCLTAQDSILFSENRESVVMKLKQNQNTDLLVRDRSGLINKPCLVNPPNNGVPGAYLIREINLSKDFLNMRCEIER